MNSTSNTRLATVEAMSPIITWRAAPSARTSCSRQNAAASTGTKASMTPTKALVDGAVAASAPSSVTSGCRKTSPSAPQHGTGDHGAPDGERRDVLDLGGLRRVVLGRAEQPRDERAAADAEHAADRHDESEDRRSERDRGEQRAVVERADEAGVDDVVDGADDHRGGHRHAEVQEGADDRRGGEVPAVGADGVGARTSGFAVSGVVVSRFVVLMAAPFRAGSSARRRTPARRGEIVDAAARPRSDC